MTAIPRVRVAEDDTGTRVFITWPDQPDDPATTVLHGAAYGRDHLGYTPDVPADAVDLVPTQTARERA